MKRTLCAAAALGFGLAVAACGSTATTHPKSATAQSGTETIRGAITGAKAVKYLASNSNKPLVFPAFVFTGPVATKTGKLSLGGPKTGEHTFVTPAGNLVVKHTNGNKGGGKPTWVKAGGRCYFRQVATTGTYTDVAGTSQFTEAAGHGTFSLTITASAKLLPGKTKCTSKNTGNPIAPAEIVFSASGPLTVR